MRIEQFRFTGFANFTQPVTWGPLEEVNLLYGPNNVGKSNLLRAVELYFHLLGAGDVVTKSQRQILDQPGAALAELMSASTPRNRGTEPQSLVFDVTWSLTEQDLQESGLFPDHPCWRVETVLEAVPSPRSIDLRIQRWMLEGMDVAQMEKDSNPAQVGFAQQIRRLLADARPFQFEQPVLPVARIGTGTSLFPQSLRDALFDARQSVAPEARRRWALFAELASTLSTELGPGTWDTTFSREAQRADVVYLNGDLVMTLEEMGSGIQRAAALLAELCLCGERWVLLEEPEWRLSPALQSRLVSLARRVLEAKLGPRQLFITTHSPMLTAQGEAFSVEMGTTGPTVTVKPWVLAGGMAREEQAVSAPPELGDLIGLVESLADLDPEILLAEEAHRINRLPPMAPLRR